MGLRALSDKHLLFKFHTKASARERKQSARSKGTPSSAEKVLLLLDKSLGLLLSPTPNTHMQDLTALIATHTHTCILLQMQWHKFALWFSSLTLHINNKDRRQQEAYLSTNYFIFWYGFFEGTVKDILIGEKNKKKIIEHFQKIWMGINEPAVKSTDGVQLCLCKLNDLSAITVVITKKKKLF